MNKNINILKEVFKGAKMGIDSISYISDKVNNPNLKNTLEHEYSMYNNILDKTKNAFLEYDEIPKDINIKDKAMLWYGIQANTMKDNSNSKIAEILIQGTNMGIIEGRKLINSNPDVDENVSKILDGFVRFQEESIEKLKEFL